MEQVPSLSLPEREVSSHNSPVETAVSARKHVLVSESMTKISDAAEGKMFPLKNHAKKGDTKDLRISDCLSSSGFFQNIGFNWQSTLIAI